MAWITTKATLAKAPNPIQTRTGTAMAGGFCFAYLGGDCPDLPLSIVAFGSVAEALLQYDKGDKLHISGDLKVHQYTNRQQEQVEQIQVTLDTVTGAKQARPIRSGESKRKKQQQGAGQSMPGGPGASSPHNVQAPAPQQGHPFNQHQNDMAFSNHRNHKEGSKMTTLTSKQSRDMAEAAEYLAMCWKVERLIKEEPAVVRIILQRIAAPCRGDTEAANRFIGLKALMDVQLEAMAHAQ